MPSKPKRPCSAPGCPELTRERWVKGQIVCFLSGFFVVVEL